MAAVARGRWNEFLIDPAVNEDAVACSSQDCRTGEARPANLSWNNINGFFEHCLRVR